MKKITIMDTIILLIAAALVIFTLMPAVARMQRSSAEAKCQSNMRRLAQAIAIYTTENSNRYPTNRILGGLGGRMVGPISAQVRLSRPGIDPATGKPYRAQLGTGISWVEGLYPYLIDAAQKTGQDWKSFMKCPKASNAIAPSPTGTNYIDDTRGYSTVTYALNYNLVEQPKWVVGEPSKLMMIREMDRLVDSVLRPANFSNGTNAVPPDCPFLCQTDTNGGGPFYTNPRQHGNGSHIVFADGHVRYFDISYFPEIANISAARCWDANTYQWYNYVYAYPSTDTERLLNKSIAITP